MSEIWFYHNTRGALEQALPQLLEKCLQREWRVLLQADPPEFLDAIDAYLWTYREESFLPHGQPKMGNLEMQPILLTDADPPENAGAFAVNIIINAFVQRDANDYERQIHLFDGNDEEVVNRARLVWQQEKDKNSKLLYWQQNERGGWIKKMAVNENTT